MASFHRVEQAALYLATLVGQGSDDSKMANSFTIVTAAVERGLLDVHDRRPTKWSAMCGIRTRAWPNRCWPEAKVRQHSELTRRAAGKRAAGALVFPPLDQRRNRAGRAHFVPELQQPVQAQRQRAGAHFLKIVLAHLVRSIAQLIVAVESVRPHRSVLGSHMHCITRALLTLWCWRAWRLCAASVSMCSACLNPQHLRPSVCRRSRPA